MGSGTALVVYFNITFDDGSMFWSKGTNTTVAEGNKSFFKGTLTVVGGKGRYAGATGDGTYTGARPAPLSAGADLYLDATVNVKKLLLSRASLCSFLSVVKARITGLAGLHEATVNRGSVGSFVGNNRHRENWRVEIDHKTLLPGIVTG
jgi:hypothetical protein